MNQKSMVTNLGNLSKIRVGSNGHNIECPEYLNLSITK